MLKKFLNKETHHEVTFLHELLKKNFNKSVLQEQLDKKLVDINYKDENGDTFLIKSLKVDKESAAIWLMEQKADISIPNDQNQTALEIATSFDRVEFIQYLIVEEKIDINYIDDNNRSFLQNVILHGHLNIAKLLIQNGADRSHSDSNQKNIIHDALSFGDREFIIYLLTLGEIDLNNFDIDGNTIMQHPEVIKNKDIAKDLIMAGADPSIKPKEGESYLLSTALKGSEYDDVIDLALKKGADVNATTVNEYTIMLELIAVAAKTPKTSPETRDRLLKISKKMISYGGNINALEENNESALFNAARLKDAELCSFLLSAGIDPNIQNNNGDTALTELIYGGIENLELIVLFLDFGAFSHLRNKEGKTIYEILNDIILHNYGTKEITDEKILSKINEKGKYITILKEFLSRYMKIDQETLKENKNSAFFDATGNPLYFEALLYNHFTLFKLYINMGIDINLLNNKGHNIFYEYILYIFTKNDNSTETIERFEMALSSLISQKADKNFKDEQGWTIFHRIVSKTECDEKLFDALIKIIKFDYLITDDLGRTVVHNCVWGNKGYIIKKIALSSRNAINQPDGYGLLPMGYAALLGNQELVITLIKIKAQITGKRKIANNAIKKFLPLTKNLEKLKVGLSTPIDIANMDKVIDHVKKEFNIDKNSN